MRMVVALKLIEIMYDLSNMITSNLEHHIFMKEINKKKSLFKRIRIVFSPSLLK